MTCCYVDSQSPRVLPGRHREECTDDACPGCQPCTLAHCRICGRTHAEGTCPECLADSRETLRDLARMCDSLPEEVEHRGIDGEAMMLLGPAADPEARGHLEASIAAGRVASDYLDHADSDQHPLFVLGTWSMVWRDALDHDDDGGYDLPELVDYLDRTMSYMGDYPHVPFEDFTEDLRRCRSHLEAVLHDGEQRDTGAPCLECKVPLRREWGRLAAADGWRCPRCKEWRSDQDYRLNVADLHREKATHLTDREMEIRTGVRAGTIREWARRGHVEKRQDSGRVVYAVADVEARTKAS